MVCVFAPVIPGVALIANILSELGPLPGLFCDFFYPTFSHLLNWSSELRSEQTGRNVGFNKAEQQSCLLMEYETINAAGVYNTIFTC